MIDPPSRRSSGFTLLEMVFTIAILAVMVGVFAPFLATMFQVFKSDTIIREADSRGRPALERIMREVRAATAASVSVSGGTTLSFTDQNGSAVSYTYSSEQLQRNGVVLASGVTALAVAASTAGGVTTVSADMTVTVDGQGVRYWASTGVRN